MSVKPLVLTRGRPAKRTAARRAALDTTQALAYNTCIDDKPYQTIRIWTRTLKKLRLLAALTGKRMIALIDELVTVALEKEQAKAK
jgi:hypothetical protein